MCVLLFIPIFFFVIELILSKKNFSTFCLAHQYHNLERFLCRSTASILYLMI